MHDRMRVHMNEIEAMLRQWHRDEEAKEHARDIEIERVYQQTLDEHISGYSETSDLMEVIESDTKPGGLWHQVMDLHCQSIRNEISPDELKRRFDAIYTAAAEIHAWQMSERVA